MKRWAVRRRRSNIGKPRLKRTLIPDFDPQELAREIEAESTKETVAPPFDPSSYARIVEERVAEVGRDTPGTSAAAPTLELAEDDEEDLPPAERVTIPTPPGEETDSLATEDTIDLDDTETIGREMYGRYLASDFPEALVLAERVLERDPEHALAKLVAERCRERLQPNSTRLNPSSVLRLRIAELERQSKHIDARTSMVLGHIDGVSDAATVAALTGMPDAEALARLHALLDLGVLEVVSA